MTPRPVLLGGLLALTAPLPAAAQGLRSAVFLPSGAKYVEVFADGNLKQAVGQDNPTQAASGSLGVSYVTDRALATFLINAVGTSPALTENFGTSLLAPAAGSSLSAGLVEVVYRPFFKRGTDNAHSSELERRLAVRAYGSVSSAHWTDTTASPAVNGTRPTVGAVAVGLGGGLRYYFVGGTLTDDTLPAKVPISVSDLAGQNVVAVYLDIGPAFRSLNGDIAGAADSQLRVRLMGDDLGSRIGLEVGLGIQANGLKAGLTFYQFGSTVPGFSGGQVVAGFSVQTALYRGFIHRGTERHGLD